MNQLIKQDISLYLIIILTLVAITVQDWHYILFIIPFILVIYLLSLRKRFINFTAFDSIKNLIKNDLEIPPRLLLKINEIKLESRTSVLKKARKIVSLLKKFKINVNYVEARKSPTITQFLFRITDVAKLESKAAQVKLSSILSYASDIKLALATNKISFIPIVEGTNYFGIEIPNQKDNQVGLLNIISNNKFQEFVKTMYIDRMINGLPIALGLDVDGKALYFDLLDAPHLLISGSTNSGKTSCLHTIINSLIYYHRPETLQLYLVDGKQLEFSLYKNLPHLKKEILVDFENFTTLVEQLFEEVQRRNVLLKDAGVQDIRRYNQSSKTKLPFIVLIVDEYAEITMQTSKKNDRFKEFENKIIRLGQIGRAAGVHIILSTQRVDKNIITGQLKINIPTRILFQVPDKSNSMIAIDKSGGETLFGKGDGLLMFKSTITRFQCAFLQNNEIINIKEWWIKNK